MDARRAPANGYAGPPAMSRAGAMDPSARPEPLRPAQAGASQSLSAAQKFDDEKRRIIDSCFSKLDETGRPLQNYITHIRVEEDGMYPTAPPPLEAGRQYKKARAIIVAVRNSGRLWVHKARENSDGTFQIGKTWPMEDLSRVEVFNIPPGPDPEQQQRAQRAGGVGFIVTMSKPYYWAATTSKEKDFFVASLIKIYRKYTGGNLPDLAGFTHSELTALTGAPPEASAHSLPPPQPQFATSQSRGQSPSSDRSGPYQGQGSRPQIAVDQAPQQYSQDGSPSQRPPSPLRPRNITPMSDYGRPSTAQSSVQGRDPSSHRPPPSREGPVTMARSQTPQEPSPRRQPPPETLQPPTRLRSPPLTQPQHTAMSDAGSTVDDHSNYHSQHGLHSSAVSHSTGGVYSTPSESLASRSMSSLQGSISELDAHSAAPQAVPERRRPPLQDVYGRNRLEVSNGPVNSLGTRSSAQELRPSPLSTSQSAAQPDASSTDQLPSSLRAGRSESPASDTLNGLEAEQQKQHRPGLGPMTGRSKQEDTANKLRKAAAAAGAFKPRAGGAGARILASKAKKSEEDVPDVQVFAPPPISRAMTTDSVQLTPIDKVAEVPILEEEEVKPQTKEIPEPKAATTSNAMQPLLSKEDIVPSKAAPEPEASVVPEEPTEAARKPRSNKYDAAFGLLDIDSSIFSTHQREYQGVLTDFGWSQSILSGKKLDALESDLRREIARLEAGSWLGSSDQKDDRVDLVQKMLDKTIAECDEMEGLLTLYGVELGTLNTDIAYIEAQSHGLQVQTANQKALQSKLQDLVDTVSIDNAQLEPLRRASISDAQGLESIELCLVQLYEALATIDPGMLKGKGMSTQENDSLNNMRSLQDRKDVYLNEIFMFLERLKQYMDPTFATAFNRTLDANSRGGAAGKPPASLDVTSHDQARTVLWQFSPLMLFVRELDSPIWESILKTYSSRAGNVYRAEFRDSISAWKRTVRKASGAEQQALFTAQEVEKSDGMIRSAQKLTVKRSQMLARGLRTGSFEKKNKDIKDPNAKFDHSSEAFAIALEEMLPLMLCEQNFLVDFFHADSLDSIEFPESVASASPVDRRGTNLYAPKSPEPDREMANRVLRAMDQIYGFWPADLQSLIDWAISSNELQAVGVLCAIERSLITLSETSQEFIIRALQKQLERLSQLFLRTVDAQIRAIEDTKVKIKKRKGVISFMKVFPNFSVMVESMLPQANTPEGILDIRTMVDKAYQRINKAMFDSLKVIAKESPVAGQATSNDPDDKEALNYHILLIENMHHYKEEVQEFGDVVLGEWRGKAMLEMAEHQDQYVAAIIRRPLGKLLDFVESVESILSSSPAARASATSVPISHPSHSRAVFKKVVASQSPKDVRKGVEALRQRVEKHFGDADEPALSQRLVTLVLDDCERRYKEIAERTRVIARDVYEGSVEIEFGPAEVQAAFRR